MPPTLVETSTTMGPTEVLDAAKRFFVRRNSLYAAFLEREGPAYAAFRGMGGEELIIGVVSEGGATKVRGSTYMFDAQIQRFFSTLPPA